MYLLHLETSSQNCSVSISKNNKLLCCCEEEFKDFIHNKKIHLFIKYVLEGAKIFIHNIKGICINKGPGSYTGLRVGTSTAKGLSYCLNIPLIAISSIRILINQYIKYMNHYNYELIIPMIDATRIEVYTAILNSYGDIIIPIHTVIINKNLFKNYRNKKILIIGNAAKKFEKFIECEKLLFDSIEFISTLPSSKNMINLGFDLFKKKQFESLISFEPYYLKNFICH